MKRLPLYGDLHPEIDLRLQSSVNQIDLGQGIVDIDIRYNPGSVARRLGHGPVSR